MSVEIVILELTNVFIAIGKGVSALSVEIVILELTNVFIAIGPGVSALSVVLAVLVLTNVFIATAKGVCADTISPRTPLTLTRRQITLSHRLLFSFAKLR